MSHLSINVEAKIHLKVCFHWFTKSSQISI